MVSNNVFSNFCFSESSALAACFNTFFKLTIFSHNAACSSNEGSGISMFKNEFSSMTFQTSDDFPVSSKFESWYEWDKLLPEIANRTTEDKVKETLNNFISSVLYIDFSQIQ